MQTTIINGQEYKVVTKKRNIKKVTLIHFTDPGHGWLKVPKRVMRALHKQFSIKDRISVYSKTRGDFVYLEQDRDAGYILSKLDRFGVKINIHERHTNKQSKIRSYNFYKDSDVIGDV